jgi:hypothetical protein
MVSIINILHDLGNFSFLGDNLKIPFSRQDIQFISISFYRFLKDGIDLGFGSSHHCNQTMHKDIVL